MNVYAITSSCHVQRTRQQYNILVDCFNKIPYWVLQEARKKFELPRLLRLDCILHNKHPTILFNHDEPGRDTRVFFVYIFLSFISESFIYISHSALAPLFFRLPTTILHIIILRVCNCIVPRADYVCDDSCI